MQQFGIIVIGDEILSGRRRDRHFKKTIELLAKRNQRLGWAHYIGDSETEIVSTLQSTMKQNAVVFCFGGIGGTPDDRTRQSAAIAADVELVRNSDAVTLIEKRFGEEAYPNRIVMADLPHGCELIPNPYNQIPGFRLNNHHFLPGFPVMAHPMMEWVLQQHYPVATPADYLEENLFIHNTPESSLIELMKELMDAHPQVDFFSLPIHRDGTINLIEFGAKGASSAVKIAMSALKIELQQRDIDWRDHNEF